MSRLMSEIYGGNAMRCLVMLVVAALWMTADAVSCYDAGDYSLSYSVEDGEVSILGFYNSGSRPHYVVIPSYIDGYPVTRIAGRAFVGGPYIEKLRIEEGIKVIGAEAFISSKNLTSVSLPRSLTTIGLNAFANCSNIEVVDIDLGHIVAILVPISQSAYGRHITVEESVGVSLEAGFVGEEFRSCNLVGNLSAFQELLNQLGLGFQVVLFGKDTQTHFLDFHGGLLFLCFLLLLLLFIAILAVVHDPADRGI